MEPGASKSYTHNSWKGTKIKVKYTLETGEERYGIFEFDDGEGTVVSNVSGPAVSNFIASLSDEYITFKRPIYGKGEFSITSDASLKLKIHKVEHYVNENYSQFTE